MNPFRVRLVALLGLRAGRRLRVSALALALAVLSLVSASPARDLRRTEREAASLLRQAAGGPVSVTLSSATGVPIFVSTGAGPGIPLASSRSARPADRARAFLRAFGRELGLPGADQVEVIRATGPDQVGMEHVRLQQVHQGIPVAGAQMTVHLRDNSVVALLAKTLPETELIDPVPTVDPSTALAVAGALIARKYGVDEADLSTPRLELFNRGILEGGSAPTHLAWFVEATAPLLRVFVWVDAQTGEELLHFNQVPQALERRVYDPYPGFPMSIGPLRRAEGDPPTGDVDVDLVYDYMGDTYDYFLTEHGRDSYDGHGATLPGVANVPLSVGHSFWDGAIHILDLLVSDDVVAHELTHGITDYSAGLYYANQSGALNESYSDIFGETVDLTNGAGNDSPSVRWMLFEDPILIGDGYRNMMDPRIGAEAGAGKMSDPEFACTSDESANLHRNSGIGNHAYALMVDGGTYNGFTVAGIGLTKAAKIQYRALTQYLIASSNLLENYNALRQSCADLVGTAGITTADCDEVGKALEAVEMYSAWPCTFTLPRKLDDFLCYRTAVSPDEPPFERFEADLSDEFESGRVQAREPRALCSPATPPGMTAHDPVTHLESYVIQPLPGEAEHRKQSNLRVVNRLGEIFVDTVRPNHLRLLVPAAVDEEAMPLPLARHTHRLDHYKCYDVRVSRRTPRFPRGIQERIVDDFEDRLYDVLRPRRLCVPVSKDGAGIKSTADYFTCYSVRRARGEPSHTRRAGIFVANKLDPERVDTKRESELCVPSAVNPLCGDGIVNLAAGEECDGADDAACFFGCDENCTCVRGCGDGVVSPGEACDPPFSQTDCPADHRCSSDCTACEPICGDGIVSPGEACDYPDVGCPPGASCLDGCAACEAICGDGVLDPGEVCDFPDVGCPAGESCRYDCAACAPVCGDGVLGPGEVCDSPNVGCPAGESCQYNCTGCETVCGDGVLGPGEVCDSPNVGCPAGKSCRYDCAVCETVCGDGFLGPGEVCDPPGSEGGCAAGEICDSGCSACDTCPAATIIPASGGTLTGATSGVSLLGSCGFSDSAPEQVFEWTPSTSGVATIETCGGITDYYTVLYIREGSCGGPELVCSYVDCGIMPSVTAGQTYTIVVDGFGLFSSSGNFTLTVSPP